MGRTLPSITQAFLEEQAAFSRFRRALRRSDQLALDDLFASAHQHLAAAAHAAHPLPFETFLLAMLLEEHKRVLHLQHLLNDPQDYSATCSPNYSPASEVDDASQALETGTGQNGSGQISEP
jgi:hypothetical protein